MSVVINDERLASELIAQRQACGGDRYDEVWEGVYVMSPLANNEHQSLVAELTTAISTVVDWKGLGRTLAGANISDRPDDWRQNYRVPDVLVLLNDTKADDRGSHWFGGPDFAVEIVSPGDRSIEKLDFYASVGTRELLIVDRDPWQLTLYRLSEKAKLLPVAISSLTQRAVVKSNVVPVQLSLDPDASCIHVWDQDEVIIRDIAIRTK